MNIVERTLIEGESVAFSIPLQASRIIISSDSAVGFYITLFEGDGQGRRFFVNGNMSPLELRQWSSSVTTLFITGNAGTLPNAESVSVWVI